MARKTRYAPLGFAHHVVNRGNDRKTIFRHHFDYAMFLELLATAVGKFDARVYGYCVMPNHFHLLVEPCKEGELSAFMQWLTGRYACHLRRITATSGHGHVFQRRFWNAPARDQAAFLANLRYIEANPVRSKLVVEADLWPWSSFTDRGRGGRKILTPAAMELPVNWSALVNTPMELRDLTGIREALVPSPGRPSKEDHRPAKGQAHIHEGGDRCTGVADSAVTYDQTGRR